MTMLIMTAMLIPAVWAIGYMTGIWTERDKAARRRLDHARRMRSKLHTIEDMARTIR